MYPMDSRNSPYLEPSIYPHQDEAKLQQQQQLHNQQLIFFSALSLAKAFIIRTTVTYTTVTTGKI
jgi:hypothetical protein